MNPKLYFDYNASTPMKPSVRKAVINAMETHYGIAAASHTPGRRAHDAVELARAKVARLINAPLNTSFLPAARQNPTTLS